MASAFRRNPLISPGLADRFCSVSPEEPLPKLPRKPDKPTTLRSISLDEQYVGPFSPPRISTLFPYRLFTDRVRMKKKIYGEDRRRYRYR